jgi:hypothetical protein
MSAVAQPRTGPFLVLGSFVVLVGVFVVVIVVVQQALVARSPSGYQLAILHVARQIGLGRRSRRLVIPPKRLDTHTGMETGPGSSGASARLHS